MINYLLIASIAFVSGWLARDFLHERRSDQRLLDQALERTRRTVRRLEQLDRRTEHQ